MLFQNKKNFLFFILAGFFITNAVTAELIGGKIIQLGPFYLSIGIIPWPVVFLATDTINEFYGKKVVQRLSFITAAFIAYAFVILFFGLKIPAAPYPNISSVSDAQFSAVFGQSLWIIIGSLTAFIVSQFVDVFVFWYFRDKTGKKMIWLRSTGSTVISQLVDTFIVGGIAFWLTGKWTTEVYINASLTGYFFKLGIAVALTPLIYIGHYFVEKYIGHDEAEKMMEKTVVEAHEK